jgi:hypothetical protein
MARTVRDSNLESRTARLRLAPAGKPYWRLIEGGLHVGYRRRAKGGGTWVGRRFLGAGKYAELKVGTADDFQDADGTTIVTFSQAQDAVRNWGSSEQRKALGLPVKAGPYSIADALGDYFSARERAGSKGLKSDRSVAASRIIPDLGALEVGKSPPSEFATGILRSPRRRNSCGPGNYGRHGPQNLMTSMTSRPFGLAGRAPIES